MPISRFERWVSPSAPRALSLGCFLGLFATVASSSVAGGEEPGFSWPQFRGPKGTGISDSRSLPDHWGGFLEPFRWKTNLPGNGWSSPVIDGDRVWLTSAEQVALPEQQAQEKLSWNPEGPLYFQTHAAVTLYALELDLENGRLLRKIELDQVVHPSPIHANNSYATPTPVLDAQHVYCHFGSLGTYAVHRETGAIRWRRTLAVDDITGPGGSPVLDGHRLILACDGGDEQYVIAVDTETGQTVWQTPRPPIVAEEGRLKRAFSTPRLIPSSDGRRQELIAPTAQWLVAYDPENGREVWRCRLTDGFSLIPQVEVWRDLLFVCTGYPHPELWAIRRGGSGDVSKTHVAWKHTKQVPEIASPIVVGDFLYMISTNGILSTLNTTDGRLQWRKRLEGSYAASPIYGDGKLYVTNQTGLTYVIRPGSAYEEIARNQVAGQTLASLAIGKDRLLIRANPILYCVEK